MDDLHVPGLRYVRCDEPGIRRVRRGRGFVFFGPHGEKVTDDRTIARIRALVIPPAWKHVWICVHPNGHLQATGVDVRGRKQYRYHAKWREVRDEVKYDKMIDFAHALPRLRRRVARDLERPGLPKEKVLATIVRLLDTTFLRIGNVRYVKDNDSFGLTTLRDKHVKVNGSEIRMSFRAKGGRTTVAKVDDQRLARIVRKCRDIPGQELFQYVAEDGTTAPITSSDVNAYLDGDGFTAKTFRTWAGTVIAAKSLLDAGPAAGEAEARRSVLAAIDAAAGELGDTRTVTRNCYIHPDVVEAFGDGSLFRIAKRKGADRPHRLRSDEWLVLAVLLDRRRRAKRREAARAA